jgi:hypothetical protein
MAGASKPTAIPDQARDDDQEKSRSLTRSGFFFVQTGLSQPSDFLSPFRAGLLDLARLCLNKKERGF